MTLTDFLIKVVADLKAAKVQFALAGGMVASLYRAEIRSTRDLDFLIQAESGSLEQAQKIIKKQHLEPHLIRKADLEKGPLFARKNKSTPVYMVLGRKDKNFGVDFILPAMPWFAEALKRAQHNLVDFGFAKIPCLSVEDVILAKLYSFKNDVTRFQDLDDLKFIFLKQHEMDLAYVAANMQVLGLPVPKELMNLVPDALRLVSKGLRRR